MTKQEILDALEEILATGTGKPKFIWRGDIEKLRDDLRRDLILFPEVYTCPTHSHT
jgi:hypothetical protein